ncbi:hypothetical protein JKP88DRAFT_244986 [Tribonema minus]|uniref:Uncharacterized protein n=1 Tax=Tribonema minus TaxID=303371 RepID=A0A836CHR2_9STRA|nr:hypothetical protein JKP88DRAFT_244986 [Tribonema minus]
MAGNGTITAGNLVLSHPNGSFNFLQSLNSVSSISVLCPLFDKSFELCDGSSDFETHLTGSAESSKAIDHMSLQVHSTGDRAVLQSRQYVPSQSGATRTVMMTATMAAIEGSVVRLGCFDDAADKIEGLGDGYFFELNDGVLYACMRVSTTPSDKVIDILLTVGHMVPVYGEEAMKAANMSMQDNEALIEIGDILNAIRWPNLAERMVKGLSSEGRKLFHSLTAANTGAKRTRVDVEDDTKEPAKHAKANDEVDSVERVQAIAMDMVPEAEVLAEVDPAKHAKANDEVDSVERVQAIDVEMVPEAEVLAEVDPAKHAKANDEVDAVERVQAIAVEMVPEAEVLAEVEPALMAGDINEAEAEVNEALTVHNNDNLNRPLSQRLSKKVIKVLGFSKKRAVRFAALAIAVAACAAKTASRDAELCGAMATAPNALQLASWQRRAGPAAATLCPRGGNALFGAATVAAPATLAVAAAAAAARCTWLTQQDELFQVFLRWKRVQLLESIDFTEAGTFDSLLAGHKVEGLKEFSRSHGDDWAQVLQNKEAWNTLLTRIDAAEQEFQEQHPVEWEQIQGLFP